jgi:hypothetical protein
MGLTPFEALYERPFLQRELILDPGTENLASHVTGLAKFQQILSEVGRETLKVSPWLPFVPRSGHYQTSP